MVIQPFKQNLYNKMILLMLLWASSCILAEKGTVMLLVGGASSYRVDSTWYTDSSEIIDPNGIINCTLSDLTDQNDQHKTLSYLPNTGELLLCGGIDKANMEQCQVLYNMKFVHHSNLTQPHPMDHHTAVVNGKLWLFGGDFWHLKEGFMIESLDGVKWSMEVEPLTPTVHDRKACSVFTGDALFLIAGGKDEDFGFSIPSANVSKLIPGASGWKSMAALPAPREDHGCAYLPSSDGFPQGSILVAGGRNDFSCYNDSLLYNIAEDTWIPAGEMEVSHTYGSMVNVDGRILFAGGLGACHPSGYVVNENTLRVDEFHLQNLGTQKPTWTELKYRLRSPRRYAAATAITVDYWNNGRSCTIPNPRPTTTAPTTSTTTTTTTNKEPTYTAPAENSCLDVSEYGFLLDLYSGKRTYEPRTLEQCKEQCSSTSFCRSLDYKASTETCWLSDKTQYTNPDEFEAGTCSNVVYLENIDGGGVVSLSTTYYPTLGAFNCVDRDLSTFCASKNTKYPYLMMEYPKPVLVEEVIVVVRKDSCGDRVKKLVVTVTNDKPTPGNLISGPTIGERFDGPATNGQTIIFSSPAAILGKYVVVQQGYTGFLNLAELQIKQGCAGADYGIACCPHFTPGDNILGTEVFIQGNEIIGGGCQETCQSLHPTSVGITESTSETYSNGKPKCWCEFGQPLHNTHNNYQTCLF